MNTQKNSTHLCFPSKKKIHDFKVSAFHSAHKRSDAALQSTSVNKRSDREKALNSFKHASGECGKKKLQGFLRYRHIPSETNAYERTKGSSIKMQVYSHGAPTLIIQATCQTGAMSLSSHATDFPHKHPIIATRVHLHRSQSHTLSLRGSTINELSPQRIRRF